MSIRLSFRRAALPPAKPVTPPIERSQCGMRALRTCVTATGQRFKSLSHAPGNLAARPQRSRVLQITDVISKADSEIEIFFLLTGYVEAVRYCDLLNCLPDSIKALPFNGPVDIRLRLDRLGVEFDNPLRQGEPYRTMVLEATAI